MSALNFLFFPSLCWVDFDKLNLFLVHYSYEPQVYLDVKNGLYSGNICCHSIRNLLFSIRLFINLNIEIFKVYLGLLFLGAYCSASSTKGKATWEWRELDITLKNQEKQRCILCKTRIQVVIIRMIKSIRMRWVEHVARIRDENWIRKNVIRKLEENTVRKM